MEMALSYAALGWRVFPVHSPGLGGSRCSCSSATCEHPAKHPRTNRGFKDATTDESQIRSWWRQWPDANVGIATGAATGNFVFDIDPRHGGDASLAELERVHGPLPATLEAKTGGGGRHVYLAHPGWKVGNRVNLRLGIDVRGDGGYVVAPPSVHATGGVYEWERGRGPGEVDISAAPRWLLDLISERPAQSLADRARKYCERAENVAIGGRNHAAFRLSGHLRGLVDGEGRHLSEPEILDFVRGWNGRNDPPLPDDELAACVSSSRVNGTPPADKPPRTRTRPRRTTAPFALTDIGNAERLIHRHGDSIKYCSAWGWMVYDGKRWKRDDERAVELRAKETVRAIAAEAAAADIGRQVRDQLLDHARKSESDARIRAQLARAIPEAPAFPADFDADPFLLNVQNGTIDLRTGELRAHRREDLITALAPVDFVPDARSEEFDRFIAFVSQGDEEFRAYLQRCAGYSLTGLQVEDAVFLIVGGGNNGKSTFLGALNATLGEYARTVPFEALLSREQGGGSGPRPELARCAGARVVAASEVEEGRDFNAATLKSLSGGDSVVVHEKYRDPFEMKPRFKLWLGANSAPRMRSDDRASRRRLKLMPFDREPETVDKNLRERLSMPEARAAFLAWALQGCMAWQREGLGSCAAVDAAVARYWNKRPAGDDVEAFVAECCERDPVAVTATAELHAAYLRWQAGLGRVGTSDGVFGRLLSTLGVESGRTVDVRVRHGIRLRPAWRNDG
ncbi:MAG: phage/plasmid primase, P4 family [Planctomycetes bacterium]|nr:phage/plasmid primase, P4 family [Planctomycetota bacterium]